MSQASFIPVNEPDLSGNEKKYLLACIESGWISSEGPQVTDFEERFSAKVDRRFGVAACNGSAALDLAVGTLKIGSGDEVIMPTFTIISCAAAVVRAGGKPVFVDCDPLTWNMDHHALESKITSKTKAILVVHIYGLPVDLDPILAIARKHDLWVIEDAAESHGQTYRGRACGSFGDVSIFSFYPNKHVTTGEGGMLVTSDPALAERARYLRNLCFEPKRRFVHEELGWNFRMTNLQAAVGLAQLERLDEVIRRKRRIGELYTERLRDLRGVQLPCVRTVFAENHYWVYGVVLDESIPMDAAEAMKRLAAEGIGTRPFFWPMHEQPVFRKQGWFLEERYPVSERIARRGFYLPSGVSLTESQIDRSVEALKKVIA